MTFTKRFSSGQSCKVDIVQQLSPDGRLCFMTQDGFNEFEQWCGKDGKPEPSLSDFLSDRAEELPERHNIFHEYRDWFVSEIIPAVANEWNVNVSAHIIGWRPHQQEIWDCVPGQSPVDRQIIVDPITGTIRFGRG